MKRLVASGDTIAQPLEQSGIACEPIPAGKPAGALGEARELRRSDLWPDDAVPAILNKLERGDVDLAHAGIKSRNHPRRRGAAFDAGLLRGSKQARYRCQPQVPCGATAAKVFKNAKITVKPVTLQPDVKSVLTQVELGNVDAGVVYVTDVMAAGAKVKGVVIPANDNASTLYPIATINSSKHKSIAEAFVAYVLSPTGQKALAAAGFQKP